VPAKKKKRAVELKTEKDVSTDENRRDGKFRRRQVEIDVFPLSMVDSLRDIVKKKDKV
jgi:hypothetical protein